MVEILNYVTMQLLQPCTLMNLLALLYPLISLFFAALVLYLSYSNNKARREQATREEQLKKQLLEASLLSEIQNKINFSLSLEKMIDIIIESLHTLFPTSNIAAVSIKNGKLIFQMHVRESVGPTFVEYVKTNLLASFPKNRHEETSEVLDECVYETASDKTNTKLPGSFFRVPLIVNKSVVGVIGIAAQRPYLYNQEDLRLLDQVVGQAGTTFSRLTQAAAKDEERALAIIENLPEGVLMVDEHHTLTLINTKARALLGIEKEKPTTLDVIAALSHLVDVSACLRDILLYKKECVPAEGKLNDIPLTVTVHPVYQSHHHRPSGALVVLHDKTKDTAKDQVKEEFTAMIVHELRSPLTAMKGASQFLKANPTMDRQEQQKLLTVIDEQSQKLLGQISFILDATRMDAGKFTVDKEIGDLKKLIMERVQLFTPEAANKHISLRSDIASEIPPVPIDAMRIGQVLNDLLSNSLKYTPPRGRITVRAQADEQKVSVSVSDTGVGIPKEKLGNVFSKFFHVDHHSGPEGEHVASTGLGLYIAKGIVEAHNGKIWVESEENKGTTISFSLPIESYAKEKPEILTATIKPGALGINQTIKRQSVH